MVLGMDWLESLPPMWIDWVKKTIRYKVGGHRICLRGIRANTRKCDPISLSELQALSQDEHWNTLYSCRLQRATRRR
jgi:hypothetical protein